MSVLLLTGPPAAGKNTVAELVAKRLDKCAVIDVDVLRQMILNPRREPWEGEEGPLQRSLGVDNACSLTRNFAGSGYSVLVIDTMTDAMVSDYRRQLSGLDPWTVQLLPSEDEVAARLLSRPDYLSRGEVNWMYHQQSTLTECDERLDNTEIAPDQAVEWLLARWPATTEASSAG